MILELLAYAYSLGLLITGGWGLWWGTLVFSRHGLSGWRVMLLIVLAVALWPLTLILWWLRERWWDYQDRAKGPDVH